MSADLLLSITLLQAVTLRLFDVILSKRLLTPETAYESVKIQVPCRSGCSVLARRGWLSFGVPGSGCGKTPLLTLIPRLPLATIPLQFLPLCVCVCVCVCVKVPRKVALWDPFRVSIFSGKALATST